MQISNLKQKAKRFKLDSSDILPLAFAGLSVGVVMLSFAVFWLAASFSKLANQKTPTLVQQVDGRSFTVRPAAYNYREPQAIRQLVQDWAVMTFTWGSLPGQQKDDSKSDEGVKVANGDRVPTTSWEASFVLDPDFRDTFLTQLATELVPDSVFTGGTSAVLVPQNISEPQFAGEGRWQVDLVATRIVFDDTNPSGYSIPFNRTFYVKAVEPPQNPLKENATDYQRAIYRMRERGLMIEEIRPLSTGEFTK